MKKDENGWKSDWAQLSSFRRLFREGVWYEMGSSELLQCFGNVQCPPLEDLPPSACINTWGRCTFLLRNIGLVFDMDWEYLYISFRKACGVVHVSPKAKVCWCCSYSIWGFLISMPHFDRRACWARGGAYGVLYIRHDLKLRPAWISNLWASNVILTTKSRRDLVGWLKYGWSWVWTNCYIPRFRLRD